MMIGAHFKAVLLLATCYFCYLLLAIFLNLRFLKRLLSFYQVDNINYHVLLNSSVIRTGCLGAGSQVSS